VNLADQPIIATLSPLTHLMLAPDIWRFVLFSALVAGTWPVFGHQTQPSVTTRAETLQANASQLEPRSVSPTGWRRTTRGWERAEAWAGGAMGRPQTINEWIVSDRDSEPQWVSASFQGVRSVHPIVLGILIVLVAVMITKVSEPADETVSGR